MISALKLVEVSLLIIIIVSAKTSDAACDSTENNRCVVKLKSATNHIQYARGNTTQPRPEDCKKAATAIKCLEDQNCRTVLGRELSTIKSDVRPACGENFVADAAVKTDKKSKDGKKAKDGKNSASIITSNIRVVQFTMCLMSTLLISKSTALSI